MEFNFVAIISRLGKEGTDRPASIDDRKARLNGRPMESWDMPSASRRRRISAPSRRENAVPRPAVECLAIVDRRIERAYAAVGARAQALKGAGHAPAAIQDTPRGYPRGHLGSHSHSQCGLIRTCEQWRCELSVDALGPRDQFGLGSCNSAGRGLHIVAIAAEVRPARGRAVALWVMLQPALCGAGRMSGWPPKPASPT